MKRLDAATIKHQIDNLLAAFPELADDDVLRADTFEGETDLHEYLERLEDKRQDAVAFADAIDARIELLKERRDRFKRRDQGLRGAMFAALQWANVPKAELPIATIAIRQGTAKVVISDESIIPLPFCRIKREPDKIKIKAALEAFESVPGASLSNAEPVLTVRIK